MSSRKKTSELHERIRGEHLGLCVAAHLARTQLVADPRVRYDGARLMEMVELAARALAKVAPLYVRDAVDGDLRELTAAELEGAKVQEGGNLMVLHDGRRFTSMTIKRADLRQAIAILKATGVPELQGSVQTQALLRDGALPAEPPLETMARVEALLRRGENAPSRISAHGVTVDLLSRNAEREGKSLLLTAREFDVLVYLMQHANQVVTRKMLLENVWDLHFDPQTNVIDVHMSRLRNAVDRDFPRPLIHTVRGAGYVLRDES